MGSATNSKKQAGTMYVLSFGPKNAVDNTFAKKYTLKDVAHLVKLKSLGL